MNPKEAFSAVREKVESETVLRALLQEPGDSIDDGVAVLHEGERVVPEEHIDEGWNVIKVPLAIGGEVKIFVGKEPFIEEAQTSE